MNEHRMEMRAAQARRARARKREEKQRRDVALLDACKNLDPDDLIKGDTKGLKKKLKEIKSRAEQVKSRDAEQIKSYAIGYLNKIKITELEARIIELEIKIKQGKKEDGDEKTLRDQARRLGETMGEEEAPPKIF